jgi:CMP-N-acetylneuraminic acid synthetase
MVGIKYNSVEIIFNNKTYHTAKQKFENCSLEITGNFLIITTQLIDENKNVIENNRVFELTQISSYKTQN